MKAKSLKCPVAFTSRIMGGKWKARILWSLIRNEPLRFNELRKDCPPISDRILSRELKELVNWGLIDRKDFEEVPPRTEYKLSEFGLTLKPVIAVMANWGLEHRERLIE